MSVVVLLLCAFACTAWARDPPRLLEFLPGVQYTDNGAPRNVCVTEEVWQWKKAVRQFYSHHTHNHKQSVSGCSYEGLCDTPSVRDSTPYTTITIPLVWHIVTSSSGQKPNNVDVQTILDQMESLTRDYEPYGVLFVVSDILFHKDDNFYCIHPYSNNIQWYMDIVNLKIKYAISPTTHMNVFVTCQEYGTMGTLLGMGTFPWDDAALTSEGGLWLNAAYVGHGQKTINHEIGHNLGLYHTFHGVAEVSGCNDECYEHVHDYSETAADFVGDFCRDTPATPMNFYCKPPSGTDCNRKSWGSTAYTNIMSYAPDDCLLTFTDQQELRMHCWACHKWHNVFQGC